MAGPNSRMLGNFLRKYGVFTYIAIGFIYFINNKISANSTYRNLYSKNDHERESLLNGLKSHIESQSQPKA